MILTLHLLLILAFSLMMPQKNLTIFLLRLTKRSTTIKKLIYCFSALQILENLRPNNIKLIVQFNLINW